MTFGLKEDALEIWSAKASDLPDEEGTDLQLAGDEIGEVPVAKSDRAGTLGSDAVLSVERAAPHMGVAASALGGWAGIMRGALGVADPNRVYGSEMDVPASEMAHRPLGTSDRRRVAAVTAGRDLAVAGDFERWPP